MKPTRIAGSIEVFGLRPQRMAMQTVDAAVVVAVERSAAECSAVDVAADLVVVQ